MVLKADFAIFIPVGIFIYYTCKETFEISYYSMSVGDLNGIGMVRNWPGDLGRPPLTLLGIVDDPS